MSWYRCYGQEDSEDCCLHDIPDTHKNAPGRICCHCGDLYEPHTYTEKPHGKYKPAAQADWSEPTHSCKFCGALWHEIPGDPGSFSENHPRYNATFIPLTFVGACTFCTRGDSNQLIIHK